MFKIKKKIQEELKSIKEKKGFKKFLISFFITSIIIFIILFLYILYVIIEWNFEKKEIIKQAEIFFNTIEKETEEDFLYKNVGGKEHSLKNVKIPITVYDYKGRVIGEFTTEKRNYIELKNVSKNFLFALFSTEDDEFFFHDGINYKSIIRAFFKNIIRLRIAEGGSTITQQLSKILFTTRERSIKRKIYEFLCAKEIEKRFSKKDILLMYVNLIFFGHGAYGVENASLLYFNKKSKELDIGESALLVSLISNPYKYSPFVNLTSSKAKHYAVLKRMAEVGYIKEKDVNKIYKDFWDKHFFNQKDMYKRKNIVKTNYCPYAMEEVRRFIVDKIGEEFFVNNDSAKIYTTFDKDLQVYTLDTLKSNLKWIRNESFLSPKNYNNIQGAVIMTVPYTGEIRVMIGGDGFTQDNQLNRVFQAKRHVGSALKPFLYISGIENKVITPYDVFEDKEVTIEIEGAPKKYRYWNVKNYRDKYRGYLNITEAIKYSSNVIAAQVAYKTGVEGMINIISETLGWSSTETNTRMPEYQLSLALGAVDMSPFELNKLYTMIANMGEIVEPFYIYKIVDPKGKVIYETQKSIPKRIVSKEAAFLVAKMMREVLRPGGTAGWIPSNYGLVNVDLAGKTGTSQDNKDIWFNMINPELVGTVWIGEDTNKRFSKTITGGVGAAPVLAAVFKKALETYIMGSFTYDGLSLVKQPVCILSGKVPAKGKCDEYVDYNALFIEGTEPGDYCSLSEEEHKKRAVMRSLQAEKEEGF